jgi:hypothetical protein
MQVDHLAGPPESPRRPPPRFFGQRYETLSLQNVAGGFITFGRNEYIYVGHRPAGGSRIRGERYVYALDRECRDPRRG